MMRKPTASPHPVPKVGEGKRGAAGRLGYLLRQASHAWRQRMDRAFVGLGVTPPQFLVLTMIANYPGLSGADLARLTFLTPQTVSVIVANLVRGGAIVRRRHNIHGRIQHLDLTPSGRALLARSRARAHAIERTLLAGLSVGEERTIRAWLVRVALADAA